MSNQVLYTPGHIDVKTVNSKTYTRFRKAIRDIRLQNDRRTLRQIDLALFRYHKISPGPDLKKSPDCRSVNNI